MHAVELKWKETGSTVCPIARMQVERGVTHSPYSATRRAITPSILNRSTHAQQPSKAYISTMAQRVFFELTVTFKILLYFKCLNSVTNNKNTNTTPIPWFGSPTT